MSKSLDHAAIGQTAEVTAAELIRVLDRSAAESFKANMQDARLHAESFLKSIDQALENGKSAAIVALSTADGSDTMIARTVHLAITALCCHLAAGINERMTRGERFAVQLTSSSRSVNHA